MLRDQRFLKLVDFPQLYDVFPGVKIRGGISYWLWGRGHSGGCEVISMIGNEVVGEPVVRKLDAYDVFVRRNEAVRILDKILSFRVNNTELLAFFDLEGFRPDGWELQAIRALDGVALESMGDAG